MLAVNCLTLLFSVFSSVKFYFYSFCILSQDCENVYELVYSSHRAVAQAAGEFLNERLFLNDEGNDPDIRTRRGKKRLENTPRIRDLVSKLLESSPSYKEINKVSST